MSLIIFLLGCISGLIFAPLFLIPGLFAISFLLLKIRQSLYCGESFKISFIFGFGHFLTSMYWISLGVSVYKKEFWWGVPIALLGIPCILGIFIGIVGVLTFFSRNQKYCQFVFCTSWVFCEWLRSWIFTGFPWNLLGYSLSFSIILLQSVSFIGIYGLSFITVYIATFLEPLFSLDYRRLKISLLNSLFVLFLLCLYGLFQLYYTPTKFSNLRVRLVQPSIKQISKWNINDFWKNFDKHINLSSQNGRVDFIIWSEAALVTPYSYEPIKSSLLDMLRVQGSILITGGITYNETKDKELKVYSSLYAVNQVGNELFKYNKVLLVPFGEYMPLKGILSLKKLTFGCLDYSRGVKQLVEIKEPKITIKPIICYEIIFPNFVRISNKEADLILNVTNDAWYGNSSGPYQHLHIARVRCIENGLPMIRVGNNGISAIIDPIGRFVSILSLNEVGYIDGYIPYKKHLATIYSKYGDMCVLLGMFMTYILPISIFFFRKILGKN